MNAKRAFLDSAKRNNDNQKLWTKEEIKEQVQRFRVRVEEIN